MRKVVLCILMVAALFAMSGFSMAQAPAVACGTLSPADCDVLVQSAAAQAGLTSATFDFTLNISASAQAFPLTGNGSYAIDPSVLAGINADALSSMTDPAAIVGLLGSVLKGFNGELNINAMGMLDLNLVLVDGVGYFNFASIAPLLGGPEALQAQNLPTGWAGLDLAGAIEMFGPMLADVDMSDVTEQADPATQQAIMNAVTSSMTVTRGADENGLAVFNSTLDFSELVKNEAFIQTVLAQAPEGTEISEEQLTEAIDKFQSLGEGVSLTATQKIDLSTFYATSISFSFALDGEALSSITGDEIDDVSLSGVLNYANFNSAPAVSAPAGAPVSTIMELMGAMGAMGGGF